MTPFADTPNDYRHVTDDAAAKLILTHYGFLDKLLEYGKQQPDRSGPWSARLYFVDDPTHWIIADYFCGLPNPADNGCVIKAIPKSRCTLEEFRQVQIVEANRRFPRGAERVESGTFRLPPN